MSLKNIFGYGSQFALQESLDHVPSIARGLHGLLERLGRLERYLANDSPVAAAGATGASPPLDAGWGAWSVEAGWTQTWITAVLAMRQLRTSLWDLTRDCRMKEPILKHRPLMIPDGTVPRILSRP